MRPLPALLAQRVRTVGGPTRTIVELRAETAADLIQTPGGIVGQPHGWKDADNWGGTDANGHKLDNSVSGVFQINDDGSLGLKPTNSAALGPSTTSGGSYRDHASAGAGLVAYMDPPNILLDPGNQARQSIGVGIQWTGTAAAATYAAVQAWLTPIFDATKPISVVTWQCTVYLWHTLQSSPGQGDVALKQVAQCVVPVTANAAGWVVFPFQDSLGNAKPFHPLGGLTFNPTASPPQYLFVVEGFDGQNNPAQNIGWAYDGSNTQFISGTIPNQIIFNAIRFYPDNAPAIGIAFPPNKGGYIINAGASNPQLCAIQLIPTSYPLTAVGPLTWKTGKPLDLKSTPAVAPEFIVRATPPPGTSVTAQVAADPAGSFITYADGDVAGVSGGDLAALPTQRKYDVQVTLQANAGGDVAPTLYGLGARVVTGYDLDNYAAVVSLDEQVDPITHVGAIPECAIKVMHGGLRDFRDIITQIVSQNSPANLYFRLWKGDRQLAKQTPTNPHQNWMHRDDYLIDDQEPQGDGLLFKCVSVMQNLRSALPALTSDVSAYPNTDSSNAGAWTSTNSSATNPLSAALADLTTSAILQVPNDTTYIQSVQNPATAQCVVNLAPIGAPPLNVGVVIQVRAAMAAASTSCLLKLELMSGGVVYWTLGSVTVSAVDAGQGSYTPFQSFLTATQIAAITQAGVWGSLQLRITASTGGGTNPQVRVSWCRVVQLGLRQTLQYPSASVPTATIQKVVQDLVANQAALDERYNGVGIQDPAASALTVAKTISVDGAGSNNLSRCLDELHYLAWIGGFCFMSSQGKVQTRMLYKVSTGTDPLVGGVTATYAALGSTGQRPAAIFPRDEITPIRVTPGWRQRVPTFDVPWGWNGQVYAGDAQIAGTGVTFFPAALIDSQPRPSQGISQWIGSDGVARGLAVRHVLAFGLGMASWRFKSNFAYPELEIGDIVNVETDRFIAFDPIAQRAIAGRQWVAAVVIGCHDAEGTEFTVWVQGYSGLRLIPTAIGAPSANPLVLPVQGYIGEAAPAGTVTNSLLQSQAFATAPWGTLHATVTNNVATAPDGTTTASGIVPDATLSSGHAANQNVGITPGENLAFSCYLKANGYTGARILVTDFTNQFTAWVDLTAGTITAAGNLGAAVINGQKITALPNGWFRVEIWGTTGGANTTWTAYVEAFDTGTDAQNNTAYSGNGTSGILAWGGQLERNGSKVQAPGNYVATTTVAVSSLLFNLVPNWFGGPGVGGVKIAYSTLAQPAAGSGQAFAGQNGQTTLIGPFAVGTLVFITITPYADANCVTSPGQAAFITKLVDTSAISTPYNNQGSGMPVASLPSLTLVGGNPAAGGPWLGIGYAASTLYRADGSTVSLVLPASGGSPSWSNASSPAAPTLTPSTSGGSLVTGTYGVVCAYMKNGGIVQVGPAQTASVTGPTGSIVVTSPATPNPNAYDGWTIFYTDQTDAVATLFYRGSGKIAFGTNFTITSVAAAQGDTMGNIQTALGAGAGGWVLIPALALQSQYIYPYIDLTLPAVNGGYQLLLSGAPPTSASASVAAVQNGDGHVPLSLGALGPITPPANGGGNTTTSGQGGKYK